MALGDSPYQTVLNDISSIIAAQGYSVSLYQSTSCPCGNTPTSPNNINCAACGGYGIVYPSPAQTITAMVSDVSQMTDMDQTGYGLAEYGDIMLYPAPGSPTIQNFDLVLLPTSIPFPTYSEVLTRGTGTTDQADYRIVSADGAWTVDPTTGISTIYHAGADFTFNGKTITWVGNTPAQGAIYSLRYGAQFEWAPFNPPTPRLAFGQDLGLIVLLRKRHIVLPNAPSLIGG